MKGPVEVWLTLMAVAALAVVFGLAAAIWRTALHGPIGCLT